MCGIAGVISLDGPQPALPAWAATMTAALRHRGPDDEGYTFFNEREWHCTGGPDTPAHVYEGNSVYSPHRQTVSFSPSLVLGHRRLSIFDVSARGHQPMCDDSRRFWIVFNGEIYNFTELRQQLVQLGHSFVSQSDTEVILAAYKQWGKACVERFNGMWAFALFDNREQTLFCSRDRFGVKPFYYIASERYFAFASEQKALLQLPIAEKKLNESAVFDYLVIGATETEEESFFKGIFELFPGHNLTLHLRSKRLQKERYYQLQVNGIQSRFQTADARQYVEKVRELLSESVRLRLRSDVPVGACLSGGIDSSALVCLANGLRSPASPLQVFTVVYPGSALDESGWARQVVEQTSSQWHTVTTAPEELLQQYQTLVQSQDIPFFGSSTLAQSKVMQLIQEKGIKVTLDGQGADELFSGYRRHQLLHVRELLSRGQWGTAFQKSSFSESKYPEMLQLGLRRLTEHLAPKAAYALLKSSKYDFQLLEPEFWNAHRERYFEKTEPNFTNLNTKLHWEYTGWKLKYLMRTADRNSMHHSVESRVPFADDHLLAEHVFSLPSAYKVHNNQTKYLLRESMKGVIPEAIRQRQDKKGFVTPEQQWFQSMKKELRALMHENLAPFVDQKQLNARWESIADHQLQGNTLGLSRFLILSLWRHTYGV